jgi:hypothetical protein
LNAAILTARAEYFETHRVPHGTVSRYSSGGCRCGACCAASTAVHAARCRSHRGVPVPDHIQHGTASTYGYWNCRCRPCTDANTVHNRPYQAAYLARRKAAS